MIKKAKKYYKYILLFLLIIFYFQYSVTITWDSTHYMNYVNIFEGKLGWNTWDVVRGPTFPTSIHLGNNIFGKTSQGLVMMTFIFYLIMLYFNYKIIKKFLEGFNIKHKSKKIILYLFIFLIIINPIIYGFYHCLLTEFVAITLATISCYIASKWVSINYCNNKWEYIKYSIIFIILIIISWFLKQPYVSVGLFVLVISYFINIFEQRAKHNFMIRTLTLIICLVTLFVSIKSWNLVLKRMGVNPDSDRNPTNSLGVQILNAVNYLEVKDGYEIFSKEFIENSKLDKNDKIKALKMIKKNDEYVIVNYKSNNKIVKSKLINRSKEQISTFYALKYLGKEFINNPIKLGSSYLDNYLAIIDVYSTVTENGVDYRVSQKIKLDFSSEIVTIAFRPYNYNQSNIFYVLPEMYEKVEQYEQSNMSFSGLNFIMQKIGFVYLLIFKIIFLILPFLFILSIILRIKNKNRIPYNYDIVIILLGYSFLHTLLHVFTGAILDRYIVPAFLTAFLGTIFLVLNIILKKNK